MTGDTEFELAHAIPPDLEGAITNNVGALETWEKISPKARNEWICWTISVKQAKTRVKHIDRAVVELSAGKRRPCCWIGCVHRTDKPVSPWVNKVILKN